MLYSAGSCCKTFACGWQDATAAAEPLGLRVGPSNGCPLCQVGRPVAEHRAPRRLLLFYCCMSWGAVAAVNVWVMRLQLVRALQRHRARMS